MWFGLPAVGFDPGVVLPAAEAQEPIDYDEYRLVAGEQTLGGHPAVGIGQRGAGVAIAGDVLDDGTSTRGQLVHESGYDGAGWSWTAGDPDEDPSIVLDNGFRWQVVSGTWFTDDVTETLHEATWDSSTSRWTLTVSFWEHTKSRYVTVRRSRPRCSTSDSFGSYVFMYAGDQPETYDVYGCDPWGTTGEPHWMQQRFYTSWDHDQKIYLTFDPALVEEGTDPVDRRVESRGTCRFPNGLTTDVTAGSAVYRLGEAVPPVPAVQCPAGTHLTGLTVVRAAVDGASVPERTLLSWDGPPFGATPVGVDAAQVRGGVFPAGTAADPVNTATGALVEHAVDAALPGAGFGLELSRSYSSDDVRSGLLGRGWRLGYEAQLSGDLAGTAGSEVDYEAADGHVEVFTAQSDGTYVAPPGVRTVLERQTDGSFTLTTADLTTVGFDAAGRLTLLEDRNGNQVTVGYDAAGFLDQVSTSGRSIGFDVDAASGRLTSVSLSDGRTVAYGYTGGLLTSVRDLRGQTWTYAYDADQRLTNAKDPLGKDLHTTVYGANGRATSQTDPRGKTSTFAWDIDADGNGTVTMTDPAGGTWTDLYAGHVLVGRVDPLNHLTSYQYDDRLRVVSVVAPAGERTSFEYDTDGNLTRTVLADGTSSTSTYNARNDVVSAVDAMGNTTSYGYDAAGNLTSVTTPDGETATTVYDTRGLPIEVYGPGGVLIAANSYDPTTGDLVAVEDAEGNRTTFGYDQAGRRVWMVEARGNTSGAVADLYRTRYDYDDGDLPTSVTSPLGHTVSATYDAAGRTATITDPKGRTVSYGYDPAGNPTSVQGPDPSVAPITSTYDDNGNLATRTDAEGRTATYSYDAGNRLTAVTDPTGTVTRAYDHAGRVTAVTDQASRTTGFDRDLMGRVTGIDYPDTTPDVTLTYDDGGRRATMDDGAGTVTYTYDDMNRLTAVARGTDTFTYGWDDLGRLTSRTVPGQPSETYSYDLAGRLATVARNSITQATFDYDPAGNLTSTALANTTTETRSYDRDGRLTDVRATRPGLLGLPEVVTRASYTLDEVGNPTAVVDESSRQALVYDTLDRLTRVCYGVVSCGTTETDWVGYTYDDVGNRLSESRPAGTTSYSYDAADRLTSTAGPAGTTAFGYDAVGNTTTAGADSYTWNAAGMMTSATVGGTTTDYTYDGDNRRLSALVTHPDATVTGTRFAWDPLSYDLAAEHDPSGSPVRAYLPGGLGVIDPATGTTTFQHPDALGSVQAATGPAGTTTATADYEPYGNLKQATGTAASPAGFTGAYTDPTGLIHLRARQYDPDTGRFLSPDPLGGGYTYAASNPARFVDPYGLWPSLRGTLNIVKQVSGYVAVGAAVALAVTPVGAAALGATLLWATAIGTASAAALAYHDCTNRKGTCAGAILETALWAAGGRYAGGNLTGSALNTLDNAATAARSRGSHLPTSRVGARSVRPPTAYSRPTGATTAAQRSSVQGRPCVECGAVADTQVADHIYPLVREHYEIGAINLQRMRALDAVQPMCPTCSARQGGQLSWWSRSMKEYFGFD